jgi:hypothetical protein
MEDWQMAGLAARRVGLDLHRQSARAMLGALGERLRKKPESLLGLKASLNPASRFDFGLLSGLPTAHNWQTKERRS